jgi:hypothetical protein
MLSLNLEESTTPAIIITDIRYHKSGVYILKERIITKEIRAPTPME